MAGASAKVSCRETLLEALSIALSSLGVEALSMLDSSWLTIATQCRSLNSQLTCSCADAASDADKCQARFTGAELCNNLDPASTIR